MELSKRLQAVADMVSKGNIVADIGCDHGYVSIYLVEKNIAPRVIAMDINEGPLQRAREHISEHKLLSYIDIRLSNGTENLKNLEADTLICAGMGGRLMDQILDAGYEKIRNMKELVLQPQSEIAQVRGFIRTIGFQIVQEDMIFEENKYYTVLRAVPKRKSVTAENRKHRSVKMSQMDSEKVQEIYDEFGECLIWSSHPILKDYLIYQEKKLSNLLQELTSAAEQTEKQKKRALELRGELDRIANVQEMML